SALVNPGIGGCIAVVMTRPARPLLRVELGAGAALDGARIARVETHRGGVLAFVLEDPEALRTLGRGPLLLEGARLVEGESTEPIRRRLKVRVAAAIEAGSTSTAVVVRAPELAGLDLGFEPRLSGKPIKQASQLKGGEWCLLVDRPPEPIFSGDEVEIEADDAASVAAWTREHGAPMRAIASVSTR
ncbi:MAG: hypothetical protein ACXWLM_12325, partial [Myxococcales bacterium]